MQTLTDRELYQALHYAKSQDEATGRAILEQFQLEQPALAQTLFGVFTSELAKVDQGMAYLFMDLCFDVICVFQHAFGNLPNQQKMGFGWLEKSAALLEPELQALMSANPMDAKIRDKLQDRFSDRFIDNNQQTALVNFMHAFIDEYAKENPAPASAVRMTKTMVFVAVQLFNGMYEHANE